MKIKSKVIGISVQGDAPCVILKDMTKNSVKLPILISEESSMNIHIYEDTKSSDHDFVYNLIKASGQDVKSVFISDIEFGVFTTEIELTNGNVVVSNVSTSLLLAIYTNCDIFIESSVLKENGIKLNEDSTVDYSEIVYDEEDSVDDLELFETRLEEAIECQDYETAALYRDKINNIIKD